MNKLDILEEQFRNLILNNCNTVGCEDCILKWEGGCRSDELQNEILSLEELKRNI